jgi:signal transduction histidine kinase
MEQQYDVVPGINSSGNNKTISVSASARLIYHLGEQLIENEFVALIELIKNAYDADSNSVKVKVDTQEETPYGKGKIVIEDNGNGMLSSTLQHVFMKISTGFKKENRFSPKFKRRVLGEKGLGRLSIQRLGDFVQITTSPRLDRLEDFLTKDDTNVNSLYNTFILRLDWRKFLNPDLELFDIQAECEFIKKERVRYGTVIEIFGIRNLNFWSLTKKLEDKFRAEIYSMVNPYLQQQEDKFELTINIDGKDITNENVSEDLVRTVSDVFVKFRFRNWMLEGSVLFKRKYINKLIKDTIKDMENEGFECLQYPTDVRDEAITFKINLNDIGWKDKFPRIKEVEFQNVFKVDKMIKAYPGNFRGKLFAINFSTKDEIEELLKAEDWGEEIKTYKQFKGIWDAANGVFIFRNSFRILPYGNKDNDWLDLSTFFTTVKRNVFTKNSVSGYFELDSITSENLTELTNRQGLIKDEYGENFFKITKDILARLASWCDIDFRSEYDVISKDLKSLQDNDQSIKEISSKNGLIKFRRVVVPEEEQKDSIERIGTQVNSIKSSVSLKKNDVDSTLKMLFPDGEIYEKVKSSNDPVITQLIIALESSYNQDKDLENRISEIMIRLHELQEINDRIARQKKQDQYINSLRMSQLESMASLAGQGIIVESLTHELNKIEQNISGYATKGKKDLLEILKKYELNKSVIQPIIGYQEGIINETVYLKQQLLHLEPTYRKNKLVFEVINLREYLTKLYIEDSPMSLKAKNNNVKIEIVGKDVNIYCNKGILVTIFDNLFLNSLYWLSDSNEIKRINFQIEESGVISVWDSGPGIHQIIEEDLFQPYKSMKPDGRGLGLFIVSELLQSINCKITLNKQERNINNRFFKFILDFSNAIILEDNSND